MCDSEFSLSVRKTFDNVGLEQHGAGFSEEEGSEDLHQNLAQEVFQPVQFIKNTDLQSVKTNLKVKGTEFSDSELLNIMVDSMVEEWIISEEHLSSEGGAPIYSMSGSGEYNISDVVQKSLVLNEEASELVAVTLNGANMHLKVRLNISTYRTPAFIDNRGQPSVLSVAGTNLHLCCSMTSDKPVFLLKRVEDKATLSLIDSEGDSLGFLFFRKICGLSMTSFESAKFEGWYISTAPADRMPVEMCQKASHSRILNFMLH